MKDALTLVADPFPRLVFKTNYSGFRDNQAKWAEICEGIVRGTGGHNSYLEAGNAASSVRNQESAPHKLAVFQPFYKWLWPRVQEVMYLQWDMEPSIDYWISDSWVNYHDRGGHTLEHTHGYAVMAVSTYITMPENGGNLEVLDPSEHFWAMHFRGHYRERAPSGWKEIPVAAGDVCMFPGWLQHRTQEHKGTAGEKRWVLTTNILNVTHSRVGRGPL